MLNYAYEMKFAEEPDYDFLKSILYGIMADNGYSIAVEFDWNEICKQYTANKEERMLKKSIANMKKSCTPKIERS